MRPSKALAVAASGCAILLAATMPATAGTAHPAHPATGKNGTFPSKLHPKTAHEGTKMTLKGHKAEKKTTYICVFTVVKGQSHGEDLTNTASVKSNKKGKFSCSLNFHKFKALPVSASGKISSHYRHCPLHKSDKKKGWQCGMAAADPNNSLGSNTIQYFTAKK